MSRGRIALAVIGVTVLGCCCPGAATVGWAVYVTQGHQALDAACFGRPVPDAPSYEGSSPPHRVVVLERQGSGFTPSYDWLADRSTAWSIGSGELALCLEPDRVVALERCESGAIRRVHRRDVRLVIAKTARILASESIEGVAPNPCNKITSDALGDEVGEAELEAWIAPFVGE